MLNRGVSKKFIKSNLYILFILAVMLVIQSTGCQSESGKINTRVTVGNDKF